MRAIQPPLPVQLGRPSCPAVQKSSGEGGAAAPDQIKLRLAGTRVDVHLPAGSDKTCDIDIGRTVLPGVSVGSAHLRFDDDWNLTGGSVTASVEVGDYVKVSGARLRVDKNGNISTQIDNVAVALGGLAKGPIALKVEQGRVSGRGVFKASDVSIGHGVVLNEGTLDVGMDSDGAFTSTGKLAGFHPSYGDVMLQANANNEVMAGKATFTLNDGIALGSNLTVRGGVFSGDFSHDALSLKGRVKLGLGEWAESEIKGGLSLPDNKWSAEGEIHQHQPLSQAGYSVTDGLLDFKMVMGEIEELQAAATLANRHWTIQLNGEYDLNTETLQGFGTAKLTTELWLGQGAMLLKTAEGKGELLDKRLVSVAGNLTGEIAYDPSCTLMVSGEDLSWRATGDNPDDGLVSGTGTVRTRGPLTFGDPAGVFGTVDEGATAAMSIADNDITQIEGGLDFSVSDSNGQMGAGTLHLALTKDAPLHGSVEFELTTDVGVPHGSGGPLIIGKGSKLVAHIAEGNLESIRLDGVSFAALGLGSDGSGRVAGTIDGSIDCSSGSPVIGGAVDITVESSLTFTDPGWGSLTFGTGGTGSMVVNNNAVTDAQILAPVSALVDGPVGTIALSGQVNGGFSRADDGSMTAHGALDLKLDSNMELPIGDKGKATVNAGASVSGAFADSRLTSLAVVAAQITAELGQFKLGGSIDSFRYGFTESDKGLSCDVGLTLEDDVALSEGTFEASLVGGGQARIVVASDKFEMINLQGIQARIRSGEVDLEGAIDEGVYDESGISIRKATVQLNEKVTFGGAVYGVSIDRGSATISTSAGKVDEATFTGFEVAVFAGDGVEFGGGPTGEVVFDQGGFTGDLTLGVREPVTIGSGGYAVTLESGACTVSMVGNQIQNINLKNFTALVSTPELSARGTISADVGFEGSALNAELTNAELADDASIGAPSSGLSLNVKQAGTSLESVVIKDNQLVSVSGGAELDIIHRGAPILSGAIADARYLAEGHKLSGSATLSLVQDLELGDGPGIRIAAEGTELAATMADSSLEKLQGSLTATAFDKDLQDFVTLTLANVTADFRGSDPKFSFEAGVKLERAFSLLDDAVTILPGASGTAAVEDNKVERLSAHGVFFSVPKFFGVGSIPTLTFDGSQSDWFKAFSFPDASIPVLTLGNGRFFGGLPKISLEGGLFRGLGSGFFQINPRIGGLAGIDLSFINGTWIPTLSMNTTIKLPFTNFRSLFSKGVDRPWNIFSHQLTLIILGVKVDVTFSVAGFYDLAVQDTDIETEVAFSGFTLDPDALKVPDFSIAAKTPDKPILTAQGGAVAKVKAVVPDGSSPIRASAHLDGGVEADLAINPTISINANVEDGKISGGATVGLTLSAELLAQLRAYLRLTVEPILSEREVELLDTVYSLPSPFSWSMNRTFDLGDQTGSDGLGSSPLLNINNETAGVLEQDFDDQSPATEDSSTDTDADGDGSELMKTLEAARNTLAMFGELGKIFRFIFKPLEVIQNLSVLNMVSAIEDLGKDVMEFIDSCDKFHEYASHGEDNGIYDLLRDELPAGEVVVAMLKAYVEAVELGARGISEVAGWVGFDDPYAAEQQFFADLEADNLNTGAWLDRAKVLRRAGVEPHTLKEMAHFGVNGDGEDDKLRAMVLAKEGKRKIRLGAPAEAKAKEMYLAKGYPEALASRIAVLHGWEAQNASDKGWRPNIELWEREIEGAMAMDASTTGDSDAKSAATERFLKIAKTRLALYRSGQYL